MQIPSPDSWAQGIFFVGYLREYYYIYIMTKKEIRNAINKAVYQYAESLGYAMSDDGDGSTVTFWPEGAASADLAIDYHRSQHYAIALNWAPDKVKQDCDRINAYAEEQARIYNV